MLLTSLLALSLAQSGAARAQLTVPPHRWTIDYGRVSCTLARPLGEEGSAIIAFNAPLGREPGELLVMEGGTGLDPRLRGEVGVRVDDGPPLILHASAERRNGRSVVKLLPMPEDFLGRVAGAHQLSLTKGNEVLLSLAMPNVRGAIDELGRCNDDLLQSWGIDMAARRALRRQPQLKSADWAIDILPTAETFLVFAAEVSDRGAPLGCRVVVSSGNERMDHAVCQLVRSRARFDPALDSAGRPVPAQYVTRLHWTVDD